MEISGSSAIVTGGASGLGGATARRLAAAGMHVVIVDLNQQLGEEMAASVNGAFVKADVRNEEQVQHAVETAVEMAPLKALVNCAGLGIALRTIDRDANPHPLDNFEFVIGVNLIGTFNCIRLGAAAMAQNDPDDGGERGAIVNTASVAAVDGQIGQAAYSASKGGVVGMTLPIARDLASVGIRVNTILPGIMDTPLLGSLPENVRDALGQSVLHPKRLGLPEEFGELALTLLTNSYMNAESVRLDGGIRMPPK